MGITFSDDDFEGVNPHHTEALVVSVEIADNVVKKVLIDNGSSVDILFMHCWERLKLEGYKLEECPKEAPLYGFGHNAVPIVGRVRLPLLFGKSPYGHVMLHEAICDQYALVIQHDLG